MMRPNCPRSPSKGFRIMKRLSRILKDYEEAGALNALVPIHAAIDDDTFMTKSGALVMIIALRGVDDECLDAANREQLVRGFQASAQALGDDIRLYQYLMKRDGPVIPHQSSENPIVQEAVKNRMAYLEAKAASLYTFETYFALVYEKEP